MFKCSRCQTEMTKIFRQEMHVYFCPECKCNSVVQHHLEAGLADEDYSSLITLLDSSQRKSKLKCFMCEINFKKVTLERPQKDRLDIEMCPKCKTIWLDKGELDHFAFDLQKHQQMINADKIAIEVQSSMTNQHLTERALGIPELVTLKKVKERGFPWCTFIIVALCALIFRSPYNFYFAYFPEGQPVLIEIFGAFFHVFSHSSLDHLVGNMFFFLLFSSKLEKAIGIKNLLLLFFTGPALSSFIYKGLGGTIPVVGASVGITTIMGAFIVIFPKAKMRFFEDRRIGHHPGSWGRLILIKFEFPAIYYVLSYFILDIAAFFDPESKFQLINYLGHIIGYCWGYLLCQFIDFEKEYNQEL